MPRAKRLTFQFWRTPQITSRPTRILLFFLLARPRYEHSVDSLTVLDPARSALSDTLPASIENPDSGTVPTWSRLPGSRSLKPIYVRLHGAME